MFFLARASVAIGVVVAAVLVHSDARPTYGEAKASAKDLVTAGIERSCATGAACGAAIEPFGRAAVDGLSLSLQPAATAPARDGAARGRRANAPGVVHAAPRPETTFRRAGS